MSICNLLRRGVRQAAKDYLAMRPLYYNEAAVDLPSPRKQLTTQTIVCGTPREALRSLRKLEMGYIGVTEGMTLSGELSYPTSQVALLFSDHG